MNTEQVLAETILRDAGRLTMQKPETTTIRALTPEQVFTVNPALVTREAIDCAITRAQVIVMLLEGDDELSREQVNHALCALQGQLAQLRQMCAAFKLG